MFKIFKPTEKNFRYFDIIISFTIIFDLFFYLLDFKAFFNPGVLLIDEILTVPFLKPLYQFLLATPAAAAILIIIIMASSILVIANKLKKYAYPVMFFGLVIIANTNPMILQFHDYIRLMCLFWIMLMEWDKKNTEAIYFLYLISFSLVYFQPMALRPIAPWLIDMDGIPQALRTEIKHTVLAPYFLKMSFLLTIMAPIFYIYEWIAPVTGFFGFKNLRKYSVISLMLFHLSLSLVLNLMTFLPVMIANLFMLYPFENKTYKYGNDHLKKYTSVFLVLILLTFPYRFSKTLMPLGLSVPLATIGQDTSWEMYSEFMPNFNIKMHGPEGDFELSAIRDWRWATLYLFSYMVLKEDDFDIMPSAFSSACFKYDFDQFSATIYEDHKEIETYQIDCSQVRSDLK